MGAAGLAGTPGRMTRCICPGAAGVERVRVVGGQALDGEGGRRVGPGIGTVLVGGHGHSTQESSGLALLLST